LFLVEVIIEILVPDGIKTGKKHEYTKERRRKLVHQFLNRNRTPLLKRKIENKKKRKEREEEREHSQLFLFNTRLLIYDG
jgi:hypothetical protein